MWMMKPGVTDTPINIPEGRVGEYQANNWFQASDPQQGGASVNPALPYYQWLVEQQLAGARIGVDQSNALTNQFNAGTNLYGAQTSRLGTAGQLFLALRDPANMYQAQALLAGDPRPGVAPAIAALGGLIGGIQNAYVDPRQYRAMDWNRSGLGDILGQGYQGPGGGGGGGERIEWKQKLIDAGIRVGDANPDQIRAAKRGSVSSQGLRDLQDGRYGYSNRALPYAQAVADRFAPGAQPGSGGVPPGVRVTNGHLADDPNGDHTPHNDDGSEYTGPIHTVSGQQAAQGGAAPPAQGGPGDGRTAAAPPAGALPGESAADTAFRQFYDSDPVMSRARKYGNPGNAISYGDDRAGHVTRVTYQDGTPDHYFLQDGTEVQKNPNANLPGAGLWVSAGPTNDQGTPPQRAVPAPAASPPLVGPRGGQPPITPPSTGNDSPRSGDGTTPSSSTSNPNRETGSRASSGPTFSASGRNIVGTTDKSPEEKARDRARRQEESRATGGTDIVARGYIPMAMGGSISMAPTGGASDPLMMDAQGGPPGAGMADDPGGAETPGEMVPGDDTGGAEPMGGGGGQGPKLVCVPDGPGTCTLIDLATGRPVRHRVPEADLQPLIQAGIAVMQGSGAEQAAPGGMPGGAGPSPGGPAPAPTVPMAMGGSLRVVRHPTHFSVAGQPFLVGEPNRQHPDGADEIVSVAPGPGGGMAVTTLPLQGARPVTHEIARLANLLVPGAPYRSNTDIRGLPAYAQGYQYHQPMMRADGGIDLIPMATGGVVYGGQSPQPITVGTLKPSFKPFKLKSDEKRLGLYPEGKFVSDSGQVQAPNGRGGYKTMPQFRTFPQTDESEVLTTVAQQIQDDPVLANSINSALSAAGRLPTSYWARINAFRAPQQAPSIFAQRSTF